MPQNGLSQTELDLDALSDPTDRYQLVEHLGSGVSADVYVATDNQSGGKKVAIKIQKLSSDVLENIQDEFRILRDLSSHPNLPDFYGVYLKKGKAGKPDELWFVMQLCEGGPITDLVRALIKQNKKLSEEHIAYILREVVKGLVYLHENHVIHRDVKGSNILLTKEGEVKIVDFGLARELQESLGKRNTCLGSPCWMAPEVIISTKKDSSEITEYDNRADVWALGITAIELGDGIAPYQDMHPTRILFQIVRNPPPTLYRPANWSQIYNDFITECLEKNPENRPFMVELQEHPFFTSLPENDFHLGQELKMLLNSITNDIIATRKEEVRVKTGFMKTKKMERPEALHVEDLATLEDITEDTIVHELFERHMNGQHFTFVGDVLIFLNPNEQLDIFGPEFDVKYHCKSRSDNAPHIYSVADSAYQDVLHHEEPQHILLAGETLSGKTSMFKHLVNHLSYLGLSPNKVGSKVEKAIGVIHAFGNAATPLHNDSTRHVLHLQMTYSSTGKLSGAIFWLYLLEKWRVTGYKCSSNANFHIFYYFYDALEAAGKLDKYLLESGRNYNYLRTSGNQDSKAPYGPRENPSGNIKMFKKIEESLTALEFDEEQQGVIWRTLAAILLLGDVEFQDQEDGLAGIKNTDIANKAAQLLNVDEKKFCWSLCNYCVVQKGTAVRRRHNKVEGEEAKKVLARGMYSRLVDWIVNVINMRLSFTRVVFGDKFYISLLDLFGFECFQKNGMEQLFINTLNEQIQYVYNQRIFVWEMQEQEEEMIPIQSLQFYDNKPTVDELMNKPDGLLYVIDEANKNSLGTDYIIEKLQTSKGPRVKMSNSKDFCVAHYTGKISYDTKDIPTKNHDFLPPEMIETMRVSTDSVIRTLFTNQLSRSGNLTIQSTQTDNQVASCPGKKKRWGAALIAERGPARKYNTESRGEFSQTRRMRTASAIFRSSSLELIRKLSSPDEGNTKLGGVHFVRCIRADLTGQPKGFQSEVVRQQLRALAVIDTARARQKGYSHRITFGEFIRRYRFLAFDFDEPVDITKENCRLLLVRLKMEGWVIGKSKVFLKYYNEEFLARLYETQVKKIIKVQTMLRAFLAKRNVAVKKDKVRQDSIKEGRLSKENSMSRQDSGQNAGNDETLAEE
uniref:Protein kinase domain-containing protein n=1 Tax=Clastoptera arizonana TaxID=38151 RepID=A0A1B6C2U7_9HEMI